MTDLITRLSKLDASDREVDADICIALQYVNQKGATNIRRDPYDAEFKDEWLDFEVDGELWTEKTPELTASVDAAIALAEKVLPGWGWELASNTSHIKNCLNPEYGKPIGKHPHWAVVANQSSRKFVDGATPAIALLIALLRAKEASNA